MEDEDLPPPLDSELSNHSMPPPVTADSLYDEHTIDADDVDEDDDVGLDDEDVDEDDVDEEDEEEFSGPISADELLMRLRCQIALAGMPGSVF